MSISRNRTRQQIERPRHSGRPRTVLNLLSLSLLVSVGCSEDTSSSTSAAPTTVASVAAPPSIETTGSSTTSKADIAATTTSIAYATTMPLTENLELGTAAMYEWDSEGGFYNVTLSGTLVIDGRCVYLDVKSGDGHVLTAQNDQLRSLLRLSESRTRFDPATSSIWVNNNGPFRNGDEVEVFGSDRWKQRWNANQSGREAWIGSYGRCEAHTSTQVASLTLEGTIDPNRPRVANLPGLGLDNWRLGIETDEEGEGGVIVIEPPCVYFVMMAERASAWEETAIEPERYFLHLARPLVRYDPDTETLWYHSKPYTSGTKIETFGGSHPTTTDNLEDFIASGCTAEGNGEHVEFWVQNMDYLGCQVMAPPEHCNPDVDNGTEQG